MTALRDIWSYFAWKFASKPPYGRKSLQPQIFFLERAIARTKFRRVFACPERVEFYDKKLERQLDWLQILYVKASKRAIC